MKTALSQEGPPKVSVEKARKLCAKYGDAILRSPSAPDLAQFAPPVHVAEEGGEEQTEKSLPSWLLYQRRLAPNATRHELSPITIIPTVTLPPDDGSLLSPCDGSLLSPSVAETDEERMSKQHRLELDEARRRAVKRYVDEKLGDDEIEGTRLERIQKNLERICIAFNANGFDPKLLVPVLVDGGAIEYQYALSMTCPTQKDQLMRQRSHTNTTQTQLCRDNKVVIKTVRTT
jgi:hypothetical protein